MEPISWKMVIAFIIAGQGHGFAIADVRYPTMELCDAEIPGAEAEVRMNFERSHHAKVDLYSECIIDIKDIDKRANAPQSSYN